MAVFKTSGVALAGRARVVYLSLPVAGGFIALFALENLVAILRTPADRLGAQTQSEG